MALDRDELKKLLKAKGVKSPDDFNAFMREVSKEVVETLFEGELTDHPRAGEKQNEIIERTINKSAEGWKHNYSSIMNLSKLFSQMLQS